MRTFWIHFSFLIFLLVLMSGCVQRERMYSGDLHIHTKASFDSTQEYETVVQQALKHKLDFIAIMDHNVIDPVIAKQCADEKRLLCIVGEEITKQEDHILAINISSAIPATLANQKTIEEIRKQGGIAIAAHPLPENGGMTLAEIQALRPAAMECANLRLEDTDYEQKIQQVADEIKIPCIYNSDAHMPDQLGIIASSCQMKELSIKEIKAAVKEGRCTRRQ